MTEKECSICISTVTPPSILVSPCSHPFCADCFGLWWANHDSCPNCRGVIKALLRGEELDREIKQGLQACPHRRCTSQLTAQDWEAHVVSCEWSPEQLQRKRAERIRAAKENMEKQKEGDARLVLSLEEFLQLGEHDLVFACTQKAVRHLSNHTDRKWRARFFIWHLYSLINQGQYAAACTRYETMDLGCSVRTKTAYALALIYQEHYTEAENVLESIPERKRNADVYTVFGFLYKKQDRYIRANMSLQQALTKGKDMLHLLLHSTLGDVCRKQEKLEQAQEHYQYVLMNMEFGNQLEEAELSCCMGKVAEQQSLYRDAIQHYKAALDQLPASHPLEGVYRVNLADAERGQSYFAAARRDYETGAQLIQQRLGQEHVELIDAYLGLGLLYKKYSKYKKSYAWTCKARALAEAKLADSHYKRALVYKALGDIHRKQRQFPEARHYFERALPSLQEHSPLAEADVRHDMGRIHCEYQQYEEAVEQVLLAYALARKNKEKKGMYTSTLGLIYGMKGEYRRAKECFKDAAKWLEKSVGSHHPEMADLFINRAEVVMKKLQLCNNQTPGVDLQQQALTYCTQAVDIITQVYGSEHAKLETLRDYVCICQSIMS